MDRVVAAWQSEIDRILSDGVSDSEWRKALNQIRASYVYGQQGVLSRALSVGRYSLLLNDPDWLRGYMDELDALEPEQVWSVVKGYLSSEKRAEMHIVAKREGA